MPKVVEVVIGAALIAVGIILPEVGVIAWSTAISIMASGALFVVSAFTRPSLNLNGGRVASQSPDAPRVVIYGQTMVGGTITYIAATGDGGNRMHLVITLAAHQCQSIDAILFDNYQLKLESGLDLNSGCEVLLEVGNYENHVYVEEKLGAPGEPAFPALIAETAGLGSGAIGWQADHAYSVGDLVVVNNVIFACVTSGTSDAGPPVWDNNLDEYTYELPPSTVSWQCLGPQNGGIGASSWTAAHRQDGCCSIHVMMVYKQYLFANGIPNIRALVSGKLCVDPRTGEKAWTDNPAVCIRDFLVDPKFGYRCFTNDEGVTSPEINDTNFIAAANLCDEAVGTLPQPPSGNPPVLVTCDQLPGGYDDAIDGRILVDPTGNLYIGHGAGYGTYRWHQAKPNGKPIAYVGDLVPIGGCNNGESLGGPVDACLTTDGSLLLHLDGDGLTVISTSALVAGNTPLWGACGLGDHLTILSTVAITGGAGIVALSATIAWVISVAGTTVTLTEIDLTNASAPVTTAYSFSSADSPAGGLRYSGPDNALYFWLGGTVNKWDLTSHVTVASRSTGGPQGTGPVANGLLPAGLTLLDTATLADAIVIAPPSGVPINLSPPSPWIEWYDAAGEVLWIQGSDYNFYALGVSGGYSGPFATLGGGANINGAGYIDPATGAFYWTGSQVDLGAGYGADPVDHYYQALTYSQSLTASVSRYLMGGWFDTSHTLGDVLQNLLSACAGKVSWISGQWNLFPGAWRPPALPAFTDDDLAGGVSMQTKLGRRDVYTGVKGQYVEPANNWQPTDFPPAVVSSYVALQNGTCETPNDRGDWAIGTVYNPDDTVISFGYAYVCTVENTSSSGNQPGLGDDWTSYWIFAGEIIWKDVQYPFTQDSSTSQRLARMDLEWGQRQITASWPLKLQGYQSIPSDVIEVTRTTFGWTAATFEITSVKLDISEGGTADAAAPVLTAVLALHQTDANVYAWSTSSEQQKALSQTVVTGPEYVFDTGGDVWQIDPEDT